MITLQFGVVKKKRNSTYIPQESELPAIQYASLKDGCSDHNPVFLLSNANNVFAFNYVKWDNWYYFIDDVVRERNQLVSVHCSLDVLATYKSEILQTTAFVAYSSVSGGSWLPDTRIPQLNNVSVAASRHTLPFFGHFTMNDVGFYLTVIGKSGGCTTWDMSIGQLTALINNISSDNNSELSSIMSQSFDTPEEAVEALTYALAKTNLFNNAYGNAASCIRACTWSPLDAPNIGTGDIYLGDYDTGIFGNKADISPQHGSFSIAIPWQYNDWRRASFEDVYFFMPCVGMVSLASENLVNSSSLTVRYSYTVLDGNICFQVLAGSQVIGSYSGKASGEYPIGLNRGASAAEMFQTFLAGAEKTVATAAQGSIVNPGAIAATGAQAVLTGIDVLTAAQQKHPSCIGGIGGGAGIALTSDAVCFTVAHGSSCTPEEMASVMGSPTMKPLQLSQCTGYCQCVNAHVALSASADAINEVDQFINTGFFIE